MKAMILAAGRGARMRPLTDTTPKPLLKVAGKPLIDWHLTKLADAGFRDVVINVSYLAEQIVAHVGDGARFGVRVTYSHEPVPLETGGGVATALPKLGNDWFLLISADIYSDINYAMLAARGQNLQHHDAHLMLVPRRIGLIGEYRLDGQMVRMIKGDAHVAECYTWASVGVFRVAAFEGLPRHEPFTLLQHFKRWCRNGGITGAVHPGRWENLGTPSELVTLNQRFAVN